MSIKRDFLNIAKIQIEQEKPVFQFYNRQKEEIADPKKLKISAKTSCQTVASKANVWVNREVKNDVHGKRQK